MAAKEVEILRELIEEGESIYKVDMAYPGWPIYVIGSQRHKDYPGHLDLSMCIETTLYRLIENGREEDVYEVIMAEKIDYYNPELYDEEGNPPDGLYEIDLSYGIYNFYPLSVVWVEDYKVPCHEYTLKGIEGTLGDITVPEDMNDEEILDMICQKIPSSNITPERTLIRDIYGDGSVYWIQPIDKRYCLRLDKAV